MSPKEAVILRRKRQVSGISKMKGEDEKRAIRGID